MKSQFPPTAHKALSHLVLSTSLLSCISFSSWHTVLQDIPQALEYNISGFFRGLLLGNSLCLDIPHRLFQ